MVEKSTILLRKDTIRMLKKYKAYSRQTYDEVIRNMIEYTRPKNQYDEFLHRVQQQKMSELWDNKHDEIWEDA